MLGRYNTPLCHLTVLTERKLKKHYQQTAGTEIIRPHRRKNIYIIFISSLGLFPVQNQRHGVKFPAVQIVENLKFPQCRGILLSSLQSCGQSVLNEGSEHHPGLPLRDGLQVPGQLDGDFIFVKKLHLLRDEQRGKVLFLLETVLGDPLSLGGDNCPQLHLHLVISLASSPVNPDLSEVGSSGCQSGDDELFFQYFNNNKGIRCKGELVKYIWYLIKSHFIKLKMFFLFPLYY